MTAFILNPYDEKLDLNNRTHLKLYTNRCEILYKEVKLYGQKVNYGNFVKLIGKGMDSRRVKECLKVPIIWETLGNFRNKS